MFCIAAVTKKLHRSKSMNCILQHNITSLQPLMTGALPILLVEPLTCLHFLLLVPRNIQTCEQGVSLQA